MSLGKDYVNRTPADVLDFIAQKRDTCYIPVVDENKALDEQGFEEETMTMLAMLKLNYWCRTEKEKTALLNLLETNERELQQKLSSSMSARELLRMFKQS